VQQLALFHGFIMVKTLNTGSVRWFQPSAVGGFLRFLLRFSLLQQFSGRLGAQRKLRRIRYYLSKLFDYHFR